MSGIIPFSFLFSLDLDFSLSSCFLKFSISRFFYCSSFFSCASFSSMVSCDYFFLISNSFLRIVIYLLSSLFCLLASSICLDKTTTSFFSSCFRASSQSFAAPALPRIIDISFEDFCLLSLRLSAVTHPI